MTEELKKIDYDECVKLSGVAEAKIEEAAEMIANKKRIIICCLLLQKKKSNI